MFEGVDSARRAERAEQRVPSGEQHVMAGAHRAVSERPGELQLAGAAVVGGEDCEVLVDAAAAGELVDVAVLDAGIDVEVELLEGSFIPSFQTAANRVDVAR